MKKISILLLLSLVLISAGFARAQVITGFGSLDINPFNASNGTTTSGFTGNWSGTVTNTTLSIAGVSDIGGGIFETLANSVVLYDPGTNGALLLTGELNAAAPTVGTFTITLYDSSFASLNYTYSWSAFTVGSFKTVAATNPVELGLFSGTVSSYGLTPTGTGSSVSFTFDTLTSVPEPSTYAMLGAGLVGLYFFGRRRKARA
jgi:hypothetical protein